jgi:hypothetical protein
LIIPRQLGPVAGPVRDHDAGSTHILPRGCQEGRDGSRDTKPAGYRHPRQRVSLGSGDGAPMLRWPVQNPSSHPNYDLGQAWQAVRQKMCGVRPGRCNEIRAADTKRALLVIYGFIMPNSIGPQMRMACRSSSTAALCGHVSSRSPVGPAGGRRKLASGTRQEGRWRRGLRVLLAPHLPPRPHQPRWRPGGAGVLPLGPPCHTA